MTRTLALLAAFSVFASPALAQDEGETAVKYKERTEIDFESVDVTGELVKPEGSLLLSRKKANFNPLIRLREHWNDEMKQSIDEVK
ncbi:MAG: hypothetical protein EP330_02605 [Deltaproteobacteria bacterium]|nr:MAG: hypothetical protein EP330_02605 [Deltaproteobacteria bacterium]